MSNTTIEIGSIHLEGFLKLHKQQTSPSSHPEHGNIFAKEDNESTQIYVMDSEGNETKISPHNKEGEWEYYCKNSRTGKVVRINMEKMIRKLEELTGERFIEES